MILLGIREMQIRTRRYHFLPAGIAKIKKTDIPSVGDDVEKLLDTVGGNVKWYKHCGKQFGSLTL